MQLQEIGNSVIVLDMVREDASALICIQREETSSSVLQS